jgi:glucoamylase
MQQLILAAQTAKMVRMINRLFAALLISLLTCSYAAAAWIAPGLTKAEDFDPDFIEQIFGPTNINGIIGNGRIAAGFSDRGEMTVLRWPTPGTFDQVRYFTIDRGLPRLGAAENMGVFIGVAVDGEDTVWVRDHVPSAQSYLHESSAILVTQTPLTSQGIKVETRDFAHPDYDMIVRIVKVEREENGPDAATLIWFENMAPCARRIPYAPLADWYFETNYDQGIYYLHEEEALLHYGDRDRVHIAFSADRRPLQFQCGGEGVWSGEAQDAFYDAKDASLSGNVEREGQSNGALTYQLDLSTGSDKIALFISAGKNESEALEIIRRAKVFGAERLQNDTERYWRDYLRDAMLPASPDERVREVCLRGLISTRQTTSESGAFMASIASQPPYAQDWPRDGAYENACLDAAGYHDAVTRHLLFYADNTQPITGGYDMNYYPDGTPGGPLFFEIDQASLVAWSMAYHYFQLPPGSDREEFWFDIAPAIERTVSFLCSWRNPITGLPLPAWESDFPMPASTLLGASNVYIASKWAARLWREAGGSEDRIFAWDQCNEELRVGILRHYVREGRLIGDIFAKTALVWPGEFFENGDPLLDTLLEELYAYAYDRLYKTGPAGGYEGLLTWALAKSWNDDPAKRYLVEQLLWPYVHEVPTTGTLHYGELHVVETEPETGEKFFVNHTGIPHQETPCLVFLTAAELYGLEPAYEDDEDDADDDADDEFSISSEQSDDDEDDSACCG